jgi:UDP-N-acetylglucosamine diphosphorylase / glucose-1-phosphate thymidylyltransferase / UDP-N-acetylgalactosamine diphosphorylase / glucosamine-1-phosphate N-acetyltransferase / galactosamine-1-phosphate N-acetyltransferase
MKRVIICDRTTIPPFGEPARDLRILNKPLWLLQRDLLARHCRGVEEVESLAEVQSSGEELLAYKDNLFFNADLIDTFIAEARASGRPRQLAFARDDKAITTHALTLQQGIRLHESGSCYVADLYYFPHEVVADPEPLVVDTMASEMGYYHIPNYMAKKGDLVFQVPLRALLSIESWVHIFLASSPFGVFADGRRLEHQLEGGRLRNWHRWIMKFGGDDWRAFRFKLGVSTTAMWEKLFGPGWRNHFLASSKLVKIGKNCSIDPTAVIHGPTIIGDNVYIGAGTVITNSIIGSNVNIMQGCQVMLSVVSDRCYLPFNAALFMTTLMDNSMVAQNSTLQLCVVGRNTFIGANNVFTDFDLLGSDIQTMHNGQLMPVGLPVLGSAVGHNVKIGSGFLVYPGRMIGSGAVLIHADPERVVVRNIPDAEEGGEQGGEPPQAIYKWPTEYEQDPQTGKLVPKASHSLHEPLQFQALSPMAVSESAPRRHR